MGVVERVRNLLTVDLGEIESSIDAPARLQRYLRELEGAYGELADACRRAETTRKYLEEKAQGNAEESRRWAQRAELALRHDNESLARIAVMKKKVLLAEGSERARDLEVCIAQQRELAREMSHLQERILATRCLRRPSASPPLEVSGEPSFGREVERELTTLKSRMNRSR